MNHDCRQKPYKCIHINCRLECPSLVRQVFWTFLCVCVYTGNWPYLSLLVSITKWKHEEKWRPSSRAPKAQYNSCKKTMKESCMDFIWKLKDSNKNAPVITENYIQS